MQKAYGLHLFAITGNFHMDLTFVNEPNDENSIYEKLI